MTDELRSWGTAALGIIAGTLRGLGYVEGRNIIFEGRYAERNYDALTDFATELVRLKVNVIVAVGNSGNAGREKRDRYHPNCFLPHQRSRWIGSGSESRAACLRRCVN